MDVRVTSQTRISPVEAAISKPDATPAPAPLDMPTQALDRAPAVAFPANSARTALARVIAFGGAAAIAAFGVQQMALVFGNETRTVLQGLLLAFFAVTFAWIALSATQAVAGMLCGPRRPRLPDPKARLTTRTALIMPVYNEDVATTCGALLAMGEMLADAGEGERFEIFILSDTRDPDVWVQETAAYARLRCTLEGRMAVWYRRRRLNVGRKAGNLREFVERWGGRYDYMLVFDADSVMSAETIIELVRRMEAAPKLGILQTVPILAGGTSLFARLQQFAGRLYGPAIARGVAAWQGLDGNYWGHNALIRVHAFAEHCGLPELKGRMPFGGHVLSHDFVEAALIRRGGWEVRMDPDLDGSWEGSPPSLLDLAVRDRRWAQGNLQHSKIVGARGLRLPNRLHFLIGIGAYMMSPIWLAMLVSGLLLTAQATLFEPEYFADGQQLFPNWPVFDAQRMAILFIAAMTLLLLPKFVGLGIALLSRSKRRAMGGVRRLLPGAAAEILLSALYAPVLMLMQARQVTEILMGRDSGWNSQSREGQAMPWREAFRRHASHVIIGAAVTVVMGLYAPTQMLWLSPVLAGLILAPALSRWSGDPRMGIGFSRLGLLTTPEEISPPPAMLKAAEGRKEFAQVRNLGLADVAQDPALAAGHRRTLEVSAPAEEKSMLASLTAAAKIDAASSATQAVGWLTREEREALAGSDELMSRFANAFRSTARA